MGVKVSQSETVNGLFKGGLGTGSGPCHTDALLTC